MWTAQVSRPTSICAEILNASQIWILKLKPLWTRLSHPKGLEIKMIKKDLLQAAFKRLPKAKKHLNLKGMSDAVYYQGIERGG